jgi:hypothetical protein
VIIFTAITDHAEALITELQKHGGRELTERAFARLVLKCARRVIA